MEKIWKTDNPLKEGDYICRMANAYIKMCHWNESEWLDMWKSALDGEVKEWIEIPYDKIEDIRFGNKRIYSDEDMQEYAEFCIRCNQKGLPCIIAKDWFEQFKKK